MKDEIAEIRDCLGIKAAGEEGHQTIEAVLVRLDAKLSGDGIDISEKHDRQFDLRNFSKIIHHLFPEVIETENFSPKGVKLVQDAIECLYDACGPEE